MDDSQDNFAKIWHWYPEDLTLFSSIWWFYLLFPRQKDGYGPKQMMYSHVSRVGNHVRINKAPHLGVARSRTADTVADPIPGIVLGWHYDGHEMHESLVRNPAMMQVTPGKSISAWDDRGFGGEMSASEGRPFSTTAHFRGEKGEANFEVWGDPVSDITAPASFERQSVFGSGKVLAWRHLSFEGEFTCPTGTEHLEGVGYFQRICLNIMPFPWKWIIARFADESIFSCFIPFLGPHLLRRGDWFFPSRMEKLTYQIQESAYFSRGGQWQQIDFTKVSVIPILSNGSHPSFHVSAEAENGDFIRFRTATYTHAQVLLERKLLGPLWSKYNYNEYIFRIEELEGSIGGESISLAQLGPGYGNCEYTWGLGL
jgi:hypothetical protein